MVRVRDFPLDEPNTAPVDTRPSVTGTAQQVMRLAGGPDGQFLAEVDETGRVQTVAGIVANNRAGSALDLAPGATATLVSFVAPAGYGVQGMVVWGDGDGLFWIEVAGEARYHLASNAVLSSRALTLPVPDLDGAEAIVALKVTNTAESTASYRGTLLGAI